MIGKYLIGKINMVRKSKKSDVLYTIDEYKVYRILGNAKLKKGYKMFNSGTDRLPLYEKEKDYMLYALQELSKDFESPPSDIYVETNRFIRNMQPEIDEYIKLSRETEESARQDNEYFTDSIYSLNNILTRLNAIKDK